MAVCLKEKEKWVEFQVEGGSFELLFRNPTYEQCLEDLLADGESEPAATRRIKRSVVGWRGVQNPDGTEIEFSTEGLLSLIGSFPQVFTALIDEVANIYLGRQGDHSKN